MNPLFTIGHSVLAIEQLVERLRTHAIQVVADVRSSPASGRSPQFNKDNLKSHLALHGIRYVFLGKELGARRKEREAYEGGIATYDRIARLSAFAEGLDRVQKGAVDYRISLLCAERDPLQCHRSILVCRHLKQYFQEGILHILDSGALEDHRAAEARLVEEEGLDLRQADAFSTPADLIDRAYEKRGLAIAYQEQEYDNKDIHDRLY